MSSAHIFYIPVFLLIGMFAGYFLGRWRADEEEREKRRAHKRQMALRKSGRTDAVD
ncbi:MAG: hypothetical protein R3E66_04205 [bacterium]